MARPVVTFLSDFGLDDAYVGTCHGVMKRIAPGLDIIDITHSIAPQDVVQGAVALAGAVPFMPEGVHLAVVDPEVGAGRRAIALRAGARLFVGPDNGLLLPAAERSGGIGGAHEIANPDFMLEAVSATFHARDVFAPAAAHLAGGVPLEQLGPSVPAGDLVRLRLPEPELEEGRVRAACLTVDRFGNVQLNVSPRQLEAAGIVLGEEITAEIRGARHRVRTARTFADEPQGTLILYEDSSGALALGVSRGSAADRLGLSRRDEVVLWH